MTDHDAIPEPDPGRGDPATPIDSMNGTRRVSSRGLLHVISLLLIVIPAVVWLLRPVLEANDPSSSGREVGESAPDFTIDLFNGSTFTLDEHLSNDRRPLVLNFWASWCLPCREEMPAFDAVAGRRPDIVFLGIAIEDTETAARAFAAQIAVGYPLGLDEDGSIAERYPILGLPTTWFITSDGTITLRWSGILDQTRLESLIDQHLSG